jgi:hypothetical protein
MKEFSYKGFDRKGRPVSGTTAAESAQEVRVQLQKFGFTDIKIREAGSQSAPQAEKPTPSEEKLPDDYVQRMVDGLIDIDRAATEQEAEEDEWRRADVIAHVKRRRRRENIGLIITVAVIALLAIYYIYDKATAITQPQPQFVIRSDSPMLTLKDVFVKGNELYFTVFSRDWNGNVRVDFKAWDPFDRQVDFGTARMGYIGEHYGANPEKTSAFSLRKHRFYERIEVVVRGDEGK